MNNQFISLHFLALKQIILLSVYFFKPVPFAVVFFFGIFILLIHSSETTAKSRRYLDFREMYDLLANLFFLKSLGFSEFVFF